MKKLLLVLATGVMVSCLNMVDPNRQVRYIDMQKSYNPILVDHLPIKLSNFTFTYSMSRFDNERISQICIIEKRNTIKKYYDIRDACLMRTNYKTTSYDSCIIIIEGFFDKQDSIQSQPCEKGLFLPKYMFSNHSKEDKIIPIDNEFEILIIESVINSKEIIADRRNMDSNNNLPDNYSRGYAFNLQDLSIIYWLITW